MKLTKSRQEKQKPVSVLDYNENMGGVDLKDQLLQPCLLERKKMSKWYIKLFRRLLNITVLNCVVICHANSGQTKIDHFKFRVELVQALLTHCTWKWKCQEISRPSFHRQKCAVTP